MKVLETDLITSVVASESLSGYPATNVQDNYPKKQWRAVPTSTATLTVTPSIGTSLSTISLFNVECASATITENGQSPVALTIETHPYNGTKFIWYEFSHVSSGTFVITFTRDSYNICACGVLQYSDRVEIANPGYGFTESSEDYSTVKRLSNGATFTKKEDIARAFSCELTLERTDKAYYALLNDVLRSHGPNPTSWLITEIDNTHWHVFARLLSPASAAHAYLNHSVITFELLEVL